MFTAFDITMMLRRANPTTNIRHGEVRDTIHNLYSNNQMGGFVRNLVRMDSGQEAFVYHPYGTDAEDYDPLFFANTTPQFLSVPSGLTTPTQVAANQPSMTTIPSLTTSPIGSNKPKRARYDLNQVPQDKFGRIRVPASALRGAGFNPNDTVRVVVDPNLIVVTGINDPYGTQRSGKKYVVDQYNNIRVHLRGKFQGNKFAVQTAPSNNMLYIRPV
jgi:hypothetical protein